MKYGDYGESIKMSIANFLKYKDEKNRISIRTANILAGQTCKKCNNRFNSECKQKSLDDSCWNWEESIFFN